MELFKIITIALLVFSIALSIYAVISLNEKTNEINSQKETTQFLSDQIDMRVTQEGLLNILNNCRGGFGGAYSSDKINETCNDVCENFNRTCINGFGHMSTVVPGEGGLNSMFYRFNCNEEFGKLYSYYKTLVENKNASQLSTECLCCPL